MDVKVRGRLFNKAVAYATGVHDIFIEAIFPSNQELLRFLKDKLPLIPGVRNSETSIVLEILKRSYEWELPKVDGIAQLQREESIAEGR